MEGPSGWQYSCDCSSRHFRGNEAFEMVLENLSNVTPSSFYQCNYPYKTFRRTVQYHFTRASQFDMVSSEYVRFLAVVFLSGCHGRFRGNDPSESQRQPQDRDLRVRLSGNRVRMFESIRRSSFNSSELERCWSPIPVMIVYFDSCVSWKLQQYPLEFNEFHSRE